MGAHGALLSYVEVGIEVDYSVGTSVETLSGAGALFRVDDDDAVLSLVDGTCLTRRDAWCIVAMLANVMHIPDSDLGHCALDDVGDLHPELAGIRLRLGDRSPVIANVLVLAGNLAVVAAIAPADIDD
jgi:hypothetical protein